MPVTAHDRRTIFGLARELGLDDEARRAVQREVTGKDSITAMTAADAGRLIAHLRQRRGPARTRPKRAGRAPGNLAREPLLAKIEAQLASMGLSWQYAESIAWHVTGGKGVRPGSQPGVQRLEWVRDWRDLRAVIAALGVEQKKRRMQAEVQDLLARLERDEDWLEQALNANLRRGRWKRNTRAMEEIINHLANRLDGEQ